MLGVGAGSVLACVQERVEHGECNMKRFILECADKTTGESTNETINANTEQEAREVAASWGKVVAKVSLIADYDAPKPLPPKIEWVWIPRGIPASVLGCLFMLLGLYIVIEGFTMETTTPSSGSFDYTTRIHNIGLLNDRTQVCAAGLVLFLSGVVLVAVGDAIRSVCRTIAISSGKPWR